MSRLTTCIAPQWISLQHGIKLPSWIATAWFQEEIGYMYHAGLYRPFPWTGPAIRRINEAGMKAVLITNQSGVSRGYFTEETVHQVHSVLDGELSRDMLRIWTAFISAPTLRTPDATARKTQTGYIIRAAHELRIDLTQSYMVGDRFLDMQMAHAVGVRAILVRTGDGSNELTQIIRVNRFNRTMSW